MCYGSSESTDLTTDTTASQFKAALIAIIDGADETDIVVVKYTTDEQTIFEVIFFKDLLNSDLEVGEYNSVTMDIDIDTIQTGRFPSDMVLSFPSRYSDSILLPNTSSTIEAELYNMISASCSETPAGEVYWTHTYDHSPGRVWGTVDNTINAMCGQYSLKNPTTVFRALASQDEVTQVTRDAIPWEIYNWVN